MLYLSSAPLIVHNRVLAMNGYYQTFHQKIRLDQKFHVWFFELFVSIMAHYDLLHNKFLSANFHLSRNMILLKYCKKPMKNTLVIINFLK